MGKFLILSVTDHEEHTLSQQAVDLIAGQPGVEDARYVYLADGRTKTAAKPKRKKRKHVQFSHKWDEALAAQFADGAAVQDEAIRYFIQKSLQGGI